MSRPDYTDPDISLSGWGIGGRYVHDFSSLVIALRIDRADPWSSLSEAEISVLHEHPERYSPAVTIRCAGDTCPEGDVLTLDGVNRRVVYRLTEPVPGTGGWVMKWPD